MPTFDSQRVRVPLSSHVNSLLTPFKFRLERWCVYTLWSQVTLLTPFRLQDGCVYPLKFFSHLNPLVTLFPRSMCVYYPIPHIQIHCLLDFRMPACTSTPSIAFKSTAHCSFVSSPPHISFSLHLNPLLTPFLFRRSCVHFLSCT